MPRTKILLLTGALLLAGGWPRRASWPSRSRAAIRPDGARNSAKAVFDGSAGGATFGAQARVGIGRSFFVAAGRPLFQKDGERVFVADASSQPFRLGHPLTVRTIPV